MQTSQRFPKQQQDLPSVFFTIGIYELPNKLSNDLTLFRIVFFGAAHGWERGGLDPPL